MFAAGGARIGVVEHVLADANADVFDGLVIDGRAGPAAGALVDAPEVDRIYERGVLDYDPKTSRGQRTGSQRVERCPR